MTTVKHVGIIMDGNRRWAKAQGLKAWDGHDKGTEVLENVIDGCVELGIEELTLYTFSTENFKRSEAEKMFLFNILKKECKKILDGDERVEKHKVCFKFVGRLELFPEKLQVLMRNVMEKTKDNSGLVVNFAMGYGGRSEIIDAVKKIVKDGAEIDEESFKKYLYLSSEPDLIIRTGGAQRLSGFLTYQSIYSELFFVEKFWPDFSKEDLKKCIEEFKERERRFGK